MTEQETNLRLRVGSFVLGALLLLVASVLALGSRGRLLEDRYQLRASFRSVEGLMVGAPVRLAGLSVGQVAGIGFGRDPGDGRLLVDLAIDRRYQEKIREDSTASISTIGVVGDKYVEVTVGRADRNVLPPQAFLRSSDPPDYGKLLENGEQIVTSLNKLASALAEGHGLLHALVYDPRGERILGDLAQSAANLKQTTGKVARGEGTLGALINDEELYGDLSKLVRGTERSWILRTLVRSSIRRGEAAKAEDNRQAARPGRTP
ncbi:MAG TPA: MlaD family protein [Candidatus Methylomirabilis sp.]|jgi:phospholipid/cholesterol/gamma-HCH transport system substrate-binding protein